jgi:hypothetical protein
LFLPRPKGLAKHKVAITFCGAQLSIYAKQQVGVKVKLKPEKMTFDERFSVKCALVLANSIIFW